MSIDRYARFLEANNITFEQHTGWLYIPVEDVAIVVNNTPAISTGYTRSLLAKVEDPWCRILIDNLTTPYGQLHLNRLDTRIDSYWTWVHTPHPALRQIIPKV